MMPAAFYRSHANRQAFRISPNDTNYFVILFDPQVAGFQHICVVEIFSIGGRTPPNSHKMAHEFFYVLSGRGRALCDGRQIQLAPGDSLLLPPGAEHVVENAGDTKLYTLTVMFPDEDFAALIRAGKPIELDDEDISVLSLGGRT